MNDKNQDQNLKAADAIVGQVLAAVDDGTYHDIDALDSQRMTQTLINAEKVRFFHRVNDLLRIGAQVVSMYLEDQSGEPEPVHCEACSVGIVKMEDNHSLPDGSGGRIYEPCPVSEERLQKLLKEVDAHL